MDIPDYSKAARKASKRDYSSFLRRLVCRFEGHIHFKDDKFGNKIFYSACLRCGAVFNYPHHKETGEYRYDGWYDGKSRHIRITRFFVKLYIKYKYRKYDKICPTGDMHNLVYDEKLDYVGNRNMHCSKCKMTTDEMFERNVLETRFGI